MSSAGQELGKVVVDSTDSGTLRNLRSEGLELENGLEQLRAGWAPPSGTVSGSLQGVPRCGPAWASSQHGGHWAVRWLTLCPRAPKGAILGDYGEADPPFLTVWEVLPISCTLLILHSLFPCRSQIFLMQKSESLPWWRSGKVVWECERWEQCCCLWKINYHRHYSWPDPS